MEDRIQYLGLSANDDWCAEFKRAEIDFVPDPMVLRAAELFLLGKSGVGETQINGDENDVWDVIDKNIDGIIAFFDILMTRERIPLIDYEATFPAHHFANLLGDMVVPVHVDGDLYGAVRAEAQEKIRKVNFEALPEPMVSDIASELGTAGYEWYPDPGVELEGDQRMAATFLLGGLIFGGYAKTSGADHILQTKRSRLLAEMTVPQDQEPLWGFEKEKQVFERLQKYIARDPGLKARDVRLPPTVLPHLLTEKPRPRAPGELLGRALTLRDSDVGAAYRQWYRTMREAWSDGRHDVDAERIVQDVANELKKRFPNDGEADEDNKPIWMTEIDVEAEAKAAVGGGGLPFEAEGKVKVSKKRIGVGIPNSFRNWIIDHLPFNRHRKLLLRISLDQRNYDNLTMGLRKVWFER